MISQSFINLEKNEKNEKKLKNEKRENNEKHLADYSLLRINIVSSA